MPHSIDFREEPIARWIALFQDYPEAAAGWVRREHAQDHFDYLAANASRVLIGGGLRHGPGERCRGGLWVMDLASREDAVALVETDA